MIMPLNELLYGVSLIDALADQLVSFDIATVAEAIGLGIGSVTAPISTLLRRGRGRPRKFAVPSRAVTLTLPENVLDALAKIDPDPSRAIVELAGRRVQGNGNGSGKSPAELATFGRRAVISIRPTPTLQRRAGIELVPMPDGRALISFEQPTTIAELELTIYDALEDKSLSPEDRRVFEAIGSILKEARRSDDVTLLRRSIIVLESTMSRRSPKSVLSKSSR